MYGDFPVERVIVKGASGSRSLVYLGKKFTGHSGNASDSALVKRSEKRHCFYLTLDTLEEIPDVKKGSKMFGFKNRIAELDEVMKKVQEVTRKSYTNDIPPSTKPLSDKAKRIHEVLNAKQLTGIKQELGTLLSILLDETVTPLTKNSHFQVGLAVVPVSNPNGHDYELGKVALFLEMGDRAYHIDEDGDFFSGNHLPYAGVDLSYVDTADPYELTPDVRPATDKEIEKFFITLTKAKNYTKTRALLQDLLENLKKA